MGMVFAGLVSALWPFATLYAFEYMTKEEHEKIFFLLYTMTYGITLGIALSANLLTMYFFYELLTLVTVPLVMHTLTREAILASRKYLYYSLGGAAFAFIGLIMIIIYGTTTDFILGGVLDLTKIGGRTNVLLFVYVMAFLGFGVKAAVFPFNSWLPQAGVAPTPVTALLHAVAVVKSGAFAIIRLTYYSFGVDFLKGTWAQTTVMLVVMFTIVYGCSRAVKETHLKKASGLFHHQQPVLHPVRRHHHDALRAGGRADPFDLPCSDQDLLLLLCGRHHPPDRETVCT